MCQSEESPAAPEGPDIGAGGYILKELCFMESPCRRTSVPEGTEACKKDHAGGDEMCEEEEAAEMNCYRLTTTSVP